MHKLLCYVVRFALSHIYDFKQKYRFYCAVFPVNNVSLNFVNTCKKVYKNLANFLS